MYQASLLPEYAALSGATTRQRLRAQRPRRASLAAVTRSGGGLLMGMAPGYAELSAPKVR